MHGSVCAYVCTQTCMYVCLLLWMDKRRAALHLSINTIHPSIYTDLYRFISSITYLSYLYHLSHLSHPSHPSHLYRLSIDLSTYSSLMQTNSLNCFKILYILIIPSMFIYVLSYSSYPFYLPFLLRCTYQVYLVLCLKTLFNSAYLIFSYLLMFSFFLSILNGILYILAILSILSTYPYLSIYLSIYFSIDLSICRPSIDRSLYLSV